MDLHKDINIFRYAESAQRELDRHGVGFNRYGFPDLTRFNYTQSIPADIDVWPYSKRNQASNPRKTILTFFEADPLLYGYLNSLDKVAANLSIYYAVTGFDLSPCLDFSVKEQKAALLLNALTNGLLLVNGIQVIPSFRIGSAETVTALKSYPRNICYSFGALGCNQNLQHLGRLLMELKIPMCDPSQILAYGRLSDADKAIFQRWNIPVVNALDYQTLSRRRTKQRTTHHV